MKTIQINIYRGKDIERVYFDTSQEIIPAEIMLEASTYLNADQKKKLWDWEVVHKN